MPLLPINEIVGKPPQIGMFKSYVTNQKPNLLSGISRQYVTDLMDQQGFVKLGRGAFGTVYKHKDYHFVVKIFFEDKMYERWVRFSLASQDNPYVPRFKGTIMKMGEHIRAVRIEPLREATGHHETEIVPHALSMAVSTFRYAFMPESEIEKNGSRIEFIRQVKRLVESGFPNYMQNVNFYNICKYLSNYPDEVDIRSDNTMYRGDQLVIIDPLAP